MGEGIRKARFMGDGGVKISTYIHTYSLFKHDVV